MALLADPHFKYGYAIETVRVLEAYFVMVRIRSKNKYWIPQYHLQPSIFIIHT